MLPYDWVREHFARGAGDRRGRESGALPKNCGKWWRRADAWAPDAPADTHLGEGRFARDGRIGWERDSPRERVTLGLASATSSL